uniref:PPM-type phosphatase domain-containing protein n=1 Tax=Lactuca sativa TaxID=4236 RepID=A0A9R1VQU8_LACSA|nr:hypothetical protein LSAT_V11C400195950 [Lactuca sativa]
MKSLHTALKEAWETADTTTEWNKKWGSAFFRAYENVDKACEIETDAGSTALPDREDEEERIVKSGGCILSDEWGTPRVNGVLAMSRAIGL